MYNPRIVTIITRRKLNPEIFILLVLRLLSLKLSISFILTIFNLLLFPQYKYTLKILFFQSFCKIGSIGFNPTCFKMFLPLVDKRNFRKLFAPSKFFTVFGIVTEK